MLYENVKFYFKSFTQLKLVKSPENYFLLLWHNGYEFLGMNYCVPKRWPMGPLQLSFDPLDSNL